MEAVPVDSLAKWKTITKLILSGSLVSALYFIRHVFGMDWLYLPLLVSVSHFFALLLSYIPIRVINNYVPFKFLPPYSNRTVRIVVVCLGLIYLVVFFLLSWMKYRAYSNAMLDFGNMDQAIYNTAWGNLLHLTMIRPPYENVSRLSFHVEFLYLLFALMYKILPEPGLLFFFQTLAFSASGIIIYFIAEKVTGRSMVALGIAAVFYLFPVNHFITLFDFHADPFSIPCLFLIYLMYLHGKLKYMWLFLVLALLCKEYVSLAIIGFGACIFLKHRDFKLGAWVAISGAAYFLIAMYIIIPYFNQGNESFLVSEIFKGSSDGQGLRGAISFAVTEPFQFLERILTRGNVENFIYLFYPVFFLSFLSPSVLVGAAPLLLKDLIFGMDIYNHHLSPVIPFVFISLIYSVKTAYPNGQFHLHSRFRLIICLVSVCIASYAYGPSPLGHRFWREVNLYIKDASDYQTDTLLSKVPANVSVSASAHIAPHLTHRKDVYVFPRPEDFSRVEYVLVDTAVPLPNWGRADNLKISIPTLTNNNFVVLENLGSIFLLKGVKP